MAKPIDTTILACPQCRSEQLEVGPDAVTCPQCHAVFPIWQGKYIFTPANVDKPDDPIDRVKHKFKKFQKLYDTLVHILGPVYLGSDIRRFVRAHVEGRNATALNLGSGNTDIADCITNVDLFPYDNVNVASDIGRLPLKDNSVDVILNVAVLEHVPEPERVIREIYRVLKPGGLVFSMIPFIQGFHASPHDYTRLTYEGMKILHGDFQLVDLRPYGGPTSGLLWVLQEWVALVLSFGIKPLHTLLYFTIMLLTFPLKFLDILLIHHPLARNIASGFTFVGRKSL